MDAHDNDREGDHSIEKPASGPDGHSAKAENDDPGRVSYAGLRVWTSLIPEFTIRASLSRAEKTALMVIALAFLALAVWGTSWLEKKNQIARGSVAFKLPVRGKYAIIAHCTSYWKTVGNITGVKMGADVVPATTITLDDRSSSGALRIYFRDTDMNTVGDPVTVGFQRGLFSNGKNSIEISASDGFHNRVDFDTYQLGTEGAWHLEVLEANTDMAPRANFSMLFSTRMSPNLR